MVLKINEYLNNFEGFKALDNLEQMKMLLEYWNNPKGVFWAKIPDESTWGLRYFFLRDVKSIDGKSIKSPFTTQGNIELHCSESRIPKKVKVDLKGGDIIIFKVEISDKATKDRIIKVDEKSIYKLNEVKSLNDDIFDGKIEEFLKGHEELIENLNREFNKELIGTKIYVSNEFKAISRNVLKNVRKKKRELEDEIEILRKEKERLIEENNILKKNIV